MYIAGLDIGTTGCKVVLFDESGKQAFTAYREYNIKRSGGLHEVDIPAVLEAVKSVLAETGDYDIAALGVTSFGETFVILDENDTPLAVSMLYTDPRGKEECAEITEHFGAEALALKTGTLMHEMYSMPKLMYLKKHTPDVFQKAKHILLMQDFIVYSLCGKAQIDYSVAARTAAFDIREKKYLDDVFAFCGIDVSLMSTPVPSGTPAGKIKKELADELGISDDILIVTGAQDQIAALVGAGVTEDGSAMDGIGTVECVPIVMKNIPCDFSVYRDGYSVVPHVSGNYALYILSYAGGASLKWFRDTLAKESDYAALDNTVPEKPTDLLILPHFAGAATPYMDSSSKAAIVGLTFEHTAADLYKALLEGTSFEIYHNLRKMETVGYTVDKAVATGGGAKSDVWLSVKADVFGIPITALEKGEVGAAGTALLAGIAIGVYSKDMSLVAKRKVFYPNAENHAYYMKQYDKYAGIYPAVKGVMNGESK